MSNISISGCSSTASASFSQEKGIMNNSVSLTVEECRYLRKKKLFAEANDEAPLLLRVKKISNQSLIVLDLMTTSEETEKFAILIRKTLAWPHMPALSCGNIAAKGQKMNHVVLCRIPPFNRNETGKDRVATMKLNAKKIVRTLLDNNNESKSAITTENATTDPKSTSNVFDEGEVMLCCITDQSQSYFFEAMNLLLDDHPTKRSKKRYDPSSLEQSFLSFFVGYNLVAKVKSSLVPLMNPYFTIPPSAFSLSFYASKKSDDNSRKLSIIRGYSEILTGMNADRTPHEQLVMMHEKARINSRTSRETLQEQTEQSVSSTPAQIEAENEPYMRYPNVFAAPCTISCDYSPPKYKKGKREYLFIENCLRDHFLFDGLDKNELQFVLDAMEPVRFKKRADITVQGDIGDFYYILYRGEVVFIVDGNPVGKGQAGCSFGELALLYNSPRAATVKSLCNCELFRIDQEGFRALLANTIAQSHRENIDILRQVSVFQGLEDSTLARISDAMTCVTFNSGSTIIEKGTVGNVFYVIKSGKVSVTDAGLGSSSFADQSLGVGEFFGERALITGELRAATVVAVNHCTLLCLSRDYFETNIGYVKDLMEKAFLKRLLQGIQTIVDANFQPFELDRLFGCLKESTLEKGKTFVTKDGMAAIDDEERGIYLLKSGLLNVTSTTGRSTQLKASDHLDLIADAASSELEDCVITAEEETACYLLSQASFFDVAGSVDRFISKAACSKTLDSRMKLDDFNRFKILGEGTFGQVWLVQHKKICSTYALKIISKRVIIDMGAVYQVLREKSMMETLNHPFIVKSFGAFQNDTNLFITMNLLPGGELFTRIHTNKSNGIKECDAKFYACCIVQALTYLHDRQVLFRDLKAENACLDAQGYCILIDLGYAKTVEGKTWTLCGTPLYLAPEIILSRGYDKSVDDWSLGILIYEMLHGFSPFYSRGINQNALYKRIIKGSYQFPEWSNISDDARDLICGLLIVRPSDRLGFGGNAVISNHSWFQSINQRALMKKLIEAPWVPPITSPTDIHHENWDHLKDKYAEASKQGALPKKYEQMFKDF